MIVASFRRHVVFRIMALVVCFAFIWESIGPMAEAQSAYDASLSTDSRNIDVASIKVPPSFGEVIDYSKGSSDKTVIHIRDAHCDYSAQNSISGLIGYLRDKYGISLVALEGGAGDYNLSVFTGIKDPKIREQTADYFVRHGEVNGAEFYTINNPSSVMLYGIEDPRLYIENLNAYRDSLKFKDDALKTIKSLSDAVSKLKPKIYPKNYKEFDEKVKLFKEDKISFEEYAAQIADFAKKENIGLSEYPNISRFYEVMDHENSINMKEAERERNTLIDLLNKKLSKKYLEELVAKTVAFNDNAIPAEEYYTYLLDKAKLCGIDLDKMPNLVKYAQCAKKTTSVNKKALEKEFRSLDSKMCSLFLKTEAERELYSLGKRLFILERIFSTTLVKDDWDYYSAHREEFDSSVIARSPAKGGTTKPFDKSSGLRPEQSRRTKQSLLDLDGYCRDMEKFYDLSLKRDDVFLEKISSKLKKEKQKNVILVTGGFHQENLKKLFTDKGYSYVEVLPRIEKGDGENPYFKLLSGGADPIIKALTESQSSLQIASYFTPLRKMAETPRGITAFQKAVAVVKQILETGEPVYCQIGNNIIKFNIDEEPKAVPWVSGMKFFSPMTRVSEVIAGSDKQEVIKFVESFGNNSEAVLQFVSEKIGSKLSDIVQYESKEIKFFAGRLVYKNTLTLTSGQKIVFYTKYHQSRARGTFMSGEDLYTDTEKGEYGRTRLAAEQGIGPEVMRLGSYENPMLVFKKVRGEPLGGLGLGSMLPADREKFAAACGSSLGKLHSLGFSHRDFTREDSVKGRHYFIGDREEDPNHEHIYWDPDTKTISFIDFGAQGSWDQKYIDGEYVGFKGALEAKLRDARISEVEISKLTDIFTNTYSKAKAVSPEATPPAVAMPAPATPAERTPKSPGYKIKAEGKDTDNEMVLNIIHNIPAKNKWIEERVEGVNLQYVKFERETFEQTYIYRANTEALEQIEGWIRHHKLDENLKNRVFAIFREAIANAFQAIDAANPTEGKIRLSIGIQNGDLVFSVSDTGSGMEQDFMRDTLFRKGGASVTSKPVRVGMGFGMQHACGDNFLKKFKGTRINVASKGGFYTFSVNPSNEIICEEATIKPLDDFTTRFEFIYPLSGNIVVPAPAATEPLARRGSGSGQAPAAGGLCVAADTMLILRNGRQIPIVRIKADDYVMSLNEDTRLIEPGRVIGLLDMGIKPVYKLTTESGRSIKTTANHPYLTRTGWVKVCNLKAGVEIAAPRDETKARYFLTRKSFSSTTNNLLSNFEEAETSRSSFFIAATSFAAEGGCIFKRIIPQCLLGGYINMFEKWMSLVTSILLSPPANFITSPFFIPDGTRFTSCPFAARYAVTSMPIFSSIRNFISRCGSESGVLLALNQFGGKVKGCLYVGLCESRIAFDNLLWAFSGLEKLKDKVYHYPRSLKAWLPVTDVRIGSDAILDLHICSPLFKKLYHTWTEMSRSGVVWADEMPRDDILWDRVVSIEFLGREQVYDIEVEGTHNFIGNNIFAHNTYMGPAATPPAATGKLPGPGPGMVTPPAPAAPAALQISQVAAEVKLNEDFYGEVEARHGWKPDSAYYSEDCFIVSTALADRLRRFKVEAIETKPQDSLPGHYFLLVDGHILIDPTWQQFLKTEERTPNLPRVLIVDLNSTDLSSELLRLGVSKELHSRWTSAPIIAAQLARTEDRPAAPAALGKEDLLEWQGKYRYNVIGFMTSVAERSANAAMGRSPGIESHDVIVRFDESGKAVTGKVINVDTLGSVTVEVKKGKKEEVNAYRYLLLNEFAPTGVLDLLGEKYPLSKIKWGSEDIKIGGMDLGDVMMALLLQKKLNEDGNPNGAMGIFTSHSDYIIWCLYENKLVRYEHWIDLESSKWNLVKYVNSVEYVNLEVKARAKFTTPQIDNAEDLIRMGVERSIQYLDKLLDLKATPAPAAPVVPVAGTPSPGAKIGGNSPTGISDNRVFRLFAGAKAFLRPQAARKEFSRADLVKEAAGNVDMAVAMMRNVPGATLTMNVLAKSVLEELEREHALSPEGVQLLNSLRAGKLGMELKLALGYKNTLANEDVGEYIRENLPTGLAADTADQRHLNLLAMLADDEERSNEDRRVYRDDKTNIIFIKIPGLLKSKQHFGHIGLGQTYGVTVVYIDEDIADKADPKARMLQAKETTEGHEYEEISLWRLALDNPDELPVSENIRAIARRMREDGVRDFSSIRGWMARAANQADAFMLAEALHQKANEKFDMDELARTMGLSVHEDGVAEVRPIATPSLSAKSPATQPPVPQPAPAPAAPVAATAPIAPDTKILRPTVDGRIDKAKAAAWVNAHPPELQELARTLVDNITYIDQEQFEKALDETVRDFKKKFSGRYAVFTSGGTLKSNYWALKLAEEHGMHIPEPALSEHTFEEWLITHPDINDILLIDDASYSGTQLSGVVEFIKNTIARNSALSGRRIHVHVLVPYLTDAAVVGIEKETGIKISIYAHQVIKTVDDIFRELVAKDQRNASLFELAKNVYINSGTNNTTLTYFQHKMPDLYSTLSLWLNKDGEMQPVTLLEGAVANTQGRHTAVVPFIPQIMAPYKEAVTAIPAAPFAPATLPAAPPTAPAALASQPPQAAPPAAASAAGAQGEFLGGRELVIEADSIPMGRADVAADKKYEQDKKLYMEDERKKQLSENGKVHEMGAQEHVEARIYLEKYLPSYVSDIFSESGILVSDIRYVGSGTFGDVLALTLTDKTGNKKTVAVKVAGGKTRFIPDTIPDTGSRMTAFDYGSSNLMLDYETLKLVRQNSVTKGHVPQLYGEIRDKDGRLIALIMEYLTMQKIADVVKNDASIKDSVLKKIEILLYAFESQLGLTLLDSTIDAFRVTDNGEIMVMDSGSFVKVESFLDARNVYKVKDILREVKVDLENALAKISELPAPAASAAVTAPIINLTGDKTTVNVRAGEDIDSYEAMTAKTKSSDTIEKTGQALNVAFAGNKYRIFVSGAKPRNEAGAEDMELALSSSIIKEQQEARRLLVEKLKLADNITHTIGLDPDINANGAQKAIKKIESLAAEGVPKNLISYTISASVLSQLEEGKEAEQLKKDLGIPNEKGSLEKFLRDKTVLDVVMDQDGDKVYLMPYLQATNVGLTRLNLVNLLKTLQEKGIASEKDYDDALNSFCSAIGLLSNLPANEVRQSMDKLIDAPDFNKLDFFKDYVFRMALPPITKINFGELNNVLNAMAEVWRSL